MDCFFQNHFKVPGRDGYIVGDEPHTEGLVRLGADVADLLSDIVRSNGDGRTGSPEGSKATSSKTRLPRGCRHYIPPWGPIDRVADAETIR